MKTLLSQPPSKSLQHREEEQDVKNIGVVGCGLMGFGIAKNLLKHSYNVVVFDINKEAVKKLENEGAQSAESVRTLAKEVDVLILSLPSPPLIEKLMTDSKDGAFDVMKKGTVILDMSTNDVELTRKLYDKAKQQEIDYYDCPLSGGPAGANDGTLTIMVGGKEEKFSTILPVLQAVGEKIDYVGASGAGQIVKLCNNMIVGGIISLVSEALLTGEKAGVPKEKMAAIFQKGSAQTKVMDVFGPNIIADTFDEVKFSLANMMKDMNLYQYLAENVEVPALASQSAHQLYQLASYQDKGQKDSTAVYEIIKQLQKGETKN
ncbi:NAD(P)-dependent oxidoreductase [Pseudogracilibacillus auburnensis]|uniref:NAD(P)-dependent oxidoreductase n=1 Tax=Pseudogracilibacillus auburnensis TaxID=1494959 RepID=UPI0027DAADED|nr:NAD(P)-dependent oxidoreductase [Pseudogracilibacillus auburnensis]